MARHPFIRGGCNLFSSFASLFCAMTINACAPGNGLHGSYIDSILAYLYLRLLPCQCAMDSELMGIGYTGLITCSLIHGSSDQRRKRETGERIIVLRARPLPRPAPAQYPTRVTACAQLPLFCIAITLNGKLHSTRAVRVKGLNTAKQPITT